MFAHACRAAVRPEAGEEAVGGVTTMAWGLSLFVHKNGVYVRPGPPSSILYQFAPTPRPHTQKHRQQRRKLTRAWSFFFFFPYHFPFSAPFAVTKFIAFHQWSFISKITGLRFFQSQMTDKDRDVCRVILCVHI